MNRNRLKSLNFVYLSKYPTHFMSYYTYQIDREPEYFNIIDENYNIPEEFKFMRDVVDYARSDIKTADKILYEFYIESAIYGTYRAEKHLQVDPALIRVYDAMMNQNRFTILYPEIRRWTLE